MVNETRLCRSLNSCRWFINNSLNLNKESRDITGFDLVVPLTEAAAYNTYVETVSNKADTLYLRCKESYSEIMVQAYLDYIHRISPNASFSTKPVTLAFDYTDEDFYGDVQGVDIHGAPASEKVTGHFKFITCSIVSHDIPEKIPLISLPIRIGHYKSDMILRCLSKIKPLVKDIDLILFDRGFYDKDLMLELDREDYSYLIFTPKHDDKKSILYSMKDGEEVAIYNNFKVNKDFSNEVGENILVFLKQIYHKKSGNNYDWVFATNTEEVLLEKIIAVYKARWRIETGFRVQDEARIKCKSKDMKIRFFIFLLEQLLQTIWICFYRNECPFKEFLIALSRTSRKWTKADKTGP